MSTSTDRMARTGIAGALVRGRSRALARRFYGDVLGITIEETPENGVVGLKSGGTSILA